MTLWGVFAVFNLIDNTPDFFHADVGLFRLGVNRQQNKTISGSDVVNHPIAAAFPPTCITILTRALYAV
jgi:hypothetical protein